MDSDKPIFCYHCRAHHPSSEMGVWNNRKRCKKSIVLAKKSQRERDAFGKEISRQNSAYAKEISNAGRTK